jgi:hypothetical protein
MLPCCPVVDVMLACRDAVAAEGDVRAAAAALEQRLSQAVEQLDTRLGLVQHKVSRADAAGLLNSCNIGATQAALPRAVCIC